MGYPEISSEYRIFLERRYVDIKAGTRSGTADPSAEALEENHLVDTLECELDYLADMIDMPDLGECLERWIAAD